MNDSQALQCAHPVGLLHDNANLLAAWVPQQWADREKSDRRKIATRVIHAIDLQLQQLDRQAREMNKPPIIPDPASVLMCTFAFLQLGLVPMGGLVGHAYLLPFWSSKITRPDGKQGMHAMAPCIGYRGYEELAARSGIRQTVANIVFNGDIWTEDGAVIDACRNHRPGPNATKASPPSAWRYAYCYGVWLDGTYTEPRLLSGREIADDREELIGRKSYAGFASQEWNALPWARKTVVRRFYGPGGIALSAAYGGVAPAVLGAQIDAAGEAGRLRDVFEESLLSAQGADVSADAIGQARQLTAGVANVAPSQDAAKPRTPAEQLARQRHQPADEPPPMPLELDGWGRGEAPEDER
jgi:recombinational DNA repair protein RecT